MVIRNLQSVMRAPALMLVLLAAVPASGLSPLLYFCTMTGEVGPGCCCEHEGEVEPATTTGSTLSAAPCCEVVSADPQVQLTRVEIVSAELEAPRVVALSHQLSDRSQVHLAKRLALPHGSRGPPPDYGSPIFIQHCCYLI